MNDATASIEADSLRESLTDTYRDTRLRHVWIVDGWNVSLTVNRGHLIVRDGIAEHARERRLTRSQRVVKRIVVLGGTGHVTLPALQWCADVGITVLFLDTAGEVYGTSFGRGSDEPRLRRAQAVAHHNGVALGIAQRLITEKVRGHARVLTTRFAHVDGAHDAASTVLGYLDPIGAAPTVERLREVEARAAAAYFDVWGSTVAATFATREAARVPAQWTRPNGRKSSLWKTGRSPRKATDPVNAMLNYAYSLAEIECRIAASAVGLDPGLGVLHSDVRHRDSLALDLLETLRPTVEEHVLDVLTVRRFRAVDFVETREGVCRLTETVTHPLAASMRAWAQQVGPVAEDVAHTLGESSPLAVRMRTPLTGARQRAAQAAPAKARSVRRLAAVEVERSVEGSPPGTSSPTLGAAAAPLPSCADCGRALTRRSAKRCGDCDAVAVVDRAASRAARGYEGRLAIESRTGVDPTQTDAAKAKRAAANARERALCAKFDREHAGVVFDRDAFAREVLPGVRELTLSQITRALGVSDSAASRMRRGLLMPHPRHWQTLKRLATPPSR